MPITITLEDEDLELVREGARWASSSPGGWGPRSLSAPLVRLGTLLDEAERDLHGAFCPTDCPCGLGAVVTAEIADEPVVHLAFTEPDGKGGYRTGCTCGHAHPFGVPPADDRTAHPSNGPQHLPLCTCGDPDDLDAHHRYDGRPCFYVLRVDG